EFLKDHYVALGIPSPLGGDDYFQNVPLVSQKAPEVTMSVNNVSYQNYEDFIVAGGVFTQTITAADIVYAGYGIDDENYSSYDGIDVKGKIVLIKNGEPKNEDGTYVTSGKKEDTRWSVGRQAIATKREAAKNKGVKTLLFMDDAYLKMAAPYMKAAAQS